MKREVDLKDISDGRLYDANDMVRTDCKGCEGCSKCCSGMGESIVLDPFDLYNLKIATGFGFADLMERYIELNIVDGLTLPNLRMTNQGCGFLDNNGLCSIHDNRPGICRLFPLGRYYNEEGFKYFIQIYECPVKNKGKVKVKKWLGYADINTYEAYINCWHRFLVQCQEALESLSEDNIRILNLLILKTFYQTEYGEAFYDEFYVRMREIREILGI